MGQWVAGHPSGGTIVAHYPTGIFLGGYDVRRKRLSYRKTAILLSALHRNIFMGTFTRSRAGEYCDVDRALVIEVDSFNPPVTFIPHIRETFPFHEISSHFGPNRSMR